MSDFPNDMPPYFGAPGFSDSYWFELLYDQPPRPDIDAVVRRASDEMLVQVVARGVVEDSGTVSVGYPDRLVNVGGTMLPAMTNFAWSGTRIKLGDYKSALEQTWEWDGARKALGRCFYKVIVGDITGSRLPYAERFRRLTTLVSACIELTKPLVCSWKEAGCLVEPARFAERTARGCNVRLFNVGISGDSHMDTLGLAALGLPDVELTFSKLDPGAVAAFLYRTAAYLFERGDVIKDGDTVPGPEGLKWKTAHDAASIAPPRTVVRVTVDGLYAPISTQTN
ncbi:MAG TPA: DUF4261 domain-containing protein [Candidatus Dormibacteraeota bacterium]|nr:DUF4261 domain-containing protein [Candidatus Dormibacteraeota bacterium]